MAKDVPPVVRLVVPCEAIDHDTAANRIVLTNPLAVAEIPDGATLPFDVAELWVYAQLAEGVGTFRLSVDLRQVYDDGTPPRSVGRSELRQLTLPGASQLTVFDIPFRMTDVPFDGSGLYEFRVLAGDEELEGRTAVLRILDPEVKP